MCQDIADSLDEVVGIDVIMIDFSKAFDLVSHDRLIMKFSASGVDVKAQLHWASLLATRLRIYSLLLNSPYVITLSCKVAVRSASASEVEGWATFVATRWRF